MKRALGGSPSAHTQLGFVFLRRAEAARSSSANRTLSSLSLLVPLHREGHDSRRNALAESRPLLPQKSRRKMPFVLKPVRKVIGENDFNQNPPSHDDTHRPDGISVHHLDVDTCPSCPLARLITRVSHAGLRTLPEK